MPFDILPLWSQWGIMGVLVAVIVYVAIEFIRGDITTRKHLEQVQKLADTFKDAWVADQQIKADLASAVARMETLSDTFEHFINSLPGGHDVP